MKEKENGDFKWLPIKIILVGLGVFIILLLVYSIFFQVKACADYECFKKNLGSCKKTEFKKEDSRAIWRYYIKGVGTEDSCSVEVNLLLIKSGETDIEDLQGESMICNVPRSSSEYPEKDLAECSGKLKEDIQEIILQKMHNYLLQNLEEITEEFRVV